MESRVKVFGHPLHQIMVVFPIGLLGTSVVFDLSHMSTGNVGAALVAHALIASGLISGLLAAPWGAIDWLAIPAGTRAKRIGALHGGGNLIVLLLFAASWWLRQGSDEGVVPTLAWVLSFCGAALTLVTGWLGGELVDRLGVGISSEVHLNAPSSLRHDPRAADTPHAAR